MLFPDKTEHILLPRTIHVEVDKMKSKKDYADTELLLT